MLIRLFEYDAQIALDNGEVSREVLTVTFPNTAVLYLRYAKTTTPDAYRYVIQTPGGSIEYDVPLLKTQQYTLDEILAKNVIDEIAKKYQNVVKGMGDVMGGALLETNARRIKNEGKVEVFLNLIADGIPKKKVQRLAAIDDELVEKALKSRKK